MLYIRYTGNEQEDEGVGICLGCYKCISLSKHWQAVPAVSLSLSLSLSVSVSVCLSVCLSVSLSLSLPLSVG